MKFEFDIRQFSILPHIFSDIVSVKPKIPIVLNTNFTSALNNLIERKLKRSQNQDVYRRLCYSKKSAQKHIFLKLTRWFDLKSVKIFFGLEIVERKVDSLISIFAKEFGETVHMHSIIFWGLNKIYLMDSGISEPKALRTIAYHINCVSVFVISHAIGNWCFSCCWYKFHIIIWVDFFCCYLLK